MNIVQAERAEMEALASVTLNAPGAIARDVGLHLVSDEGVIMALATTGLVLRRHLRVIADMERRAR